MRVGALSLLLPPYRCLEPIEPEALASRTRSRPGAAIAWCLDEGDWAKIFEAVRSRPGGVALIAVLPRVESVATDPEVLRIVEFCRPHSILPHHPEPSVEDLSSLLRRSPEDLAIEITDYLAWRGIGVDADTRRLIRRTVELSGEIRSVNSLSRSLYLSRRALGRRFLTQGLPVPSHWLHFGRILRAALRLQGSQETLFSIACDLGYPDGFALSNQMYRLTGVRPTAARDCLGWEWVMESWLRREAEMGGFAPGLIPVPQEAPSQPLRRTSGARPATRRLPGERKTST